MEEEASAEKGFYISFDNEPPKRPKPPLRTKRSPKKETSETTTTTSGHSSASTLDSGRSMNEMNDRFATTTRKSSINEMGSSPNHYSSERSFDDGRGSEPIPAKRHHIADLGTGTMNVNENSYGYDVYQAQQQQQQMVQPRKHLEDVTNYEPQQMHNLSYGSSPSEYGQGGMMMGGGGGGGGGGQELNGGGGSIRTNHHGNSEGTAKPIIIANSNLDPVSGEGIVWDLPEIGANFLFFSVICGRDGAEEGKDHVDVIATQTTAGGGEGHEGGDCDAEAGKGAREGGGEAAKEG